MFETELPLALIMEEILGWENPKGKEEEVQEDEKEERQK